MIPTIYVTKTRDGLFTFKCERCRKKHVHGAQEGHRVAHCGYYPGGYVLARKKAEKKS